MKRISYFYVLLCATALAGCTHEEAALENSNQNAPQGSQAATLTATIGINTRTYADGTTVKWSEGDSFKAFSADGGYSYGTFVQTGTIGTDGKTATFNCPSMVGEDVSELNYAVYPADGFTVTSNSITYEFPAEYTYPNSNAPMFGTISNGNVVFDQLLCGMVRVTLTGIPEGGISGSLKLKYLISDTPATPSSSWSVTMLASTYIYNQTRTSDETLLSFSSISSGSLILDIPVLTGDYTADNIAVTLKIDGEVAERSVGTIAEKIDAETIKNMPTVSLSALTSATITVDADTELKASDLSSYTDLTISGTLDAEDLTAIKEWAETNDGETTEKTLDLSGVTIAEGDELNFANCTTLAKVVLPEVTTSIANGAFNGCTNLVSVENTSKATTIGEKAFYGCANLTSIDLSNVTSIGDAAFQNCTSLREVINATKVETIGDYAFDGCTSLTSLDLSNVTTIGNYAFHGCTNLTSIEIPSSVTSIGDSAFAGCSSLEKVTCKADITSDSVSLAENAFSGIAEGAVLYVPNKYLEAYTAKWSSSFEGGVKPITSSGSLTGEITGGYSE